MAKKKALFDEDELDLDSANTGATEIAKMRMLSDIKEHQTFRSLFPLDKDSISEIAEDITRHGYDKSQPVHVWKERDILIDGHTRLAAAKKAGVFEIPVYEHSFKAEKDALLYAYALQLNRRNLSDAELLIAVQKYMELGGKKTKGRVREVLAQKTGMSPATIARAMAVAKDSEAVKAVKYGKSSTHKEYNKLMEAKKASAREGAPFDDFDDISESLSESAGNPPPVAITDHSDGIERPAASTSAETEGDMRDREKYREGYVDGFRRAFTFAVSEMLRGREAKGIFNDSRVKGLSDGRILRFKLPDDAEGLIMKITLNKR
nr:ParB N-terminal domain-containing protein [Schwartzia sp. (in: firmicutes)]